MVTSASLLLPRMCRVRRSDSFSDSSPKVAELTLMLEVDDPAHDRKLGGLDDVVLLGANLVGGHSFADPFHQMDGPLGHFHVGMARGPLQERIRLTAHQDQFAGGIIPFAEGVAAKLLDGVIDLFADALGKMQAKIDAADFGEGDGQLAITGHHVQLSWRMAMRTKLPSPRRTSARL